MRIRRYYDGPGGGPYDKRLVHVQLFAQMGPVWAPAPKDPPINVFRRESLRRKGLVEFRWWRGVKGERNRGGLFLARLTPAGLAYRDQLMQYEVRKVRNGTKEEIAAMRRRLGLG